MSLFSSLFIFAAILAGECSAKTAGATNTEPFASPCFPSKNGIDVLDPSACALVQSNYTDRYFRLTKAGAYMNTQWETCQASGAQCLLDYANPVNELAVQRPRTCKQGSVPELTSEITSPQDVKVALKLAKSMHMPVVIKNTGHDYKGRSSAPGSLSLWTHKLNQMSYNATFVADGCSSAVSAITIGAGVLTGDLLNFADANNLTIVGGNDPTVGAAGGWLQGGGHSFLTPAYGLGVDRAVQFRVVTASGQYLTANACQNKDLFWALRGGGGSTFGVVLESTVLADPRVPVQVALLVFAANATTTRALWDLVLENQLAWSEAGWGGLVNQRQALYVNPKLNVTEASASMLPLKNFSSALGSSVVLKSVFAEFPSYLSFFNTFILPSPAPVGESVALASRFVPATSLNSASSRSALVDALLYAATNVSDIRIFSTTPYAFKGDAGATSVTPAWRSSALHVIVDRVWNFNATKSEVRGHYGAVSAAVSPLRKITPDASYQNEGDVHEPNYEAAFWGANYARLLSIKKK